MFFNLNALSCEILVYNFVLLQETLSDLVGMLKNDRHNTTNEGQRGHISFVTVIFFLAAGVKE